MGMAILDIRKGAALQVKVRGTTIKGLINKLCDKYLSFDKYLSPSKKLLISCEKPLYDEFEDLPAKIYTECEILDHAVMFWPN